MPRANQYQPSGNAGEISPRLHARTDFTKYGSAWALCENMTPLAEGAMQRRSGTRYVHTLADQTKRARLLPFLFSNTQAYPMVFEDQAIYFNRNQGQILVADTSASITNGTFDSDTSGWTDQSTGSASIDHAFIGTTTEGTFGFSAVSQVMLGGNTSGTRAGGLMLTINTTGTVDAVRLTVNVVTTAFNAQVSIWTDSSGSPGTQVGSNSDSVNLSSTGVKEFTWSSGSPSVTSGTVYWIVVEDVDDTTGDVDVSVCNDLGAGYASGRADLETSIADGTNTFPTSREWRFAIDIVPDSALAMLALSGASSETAIAEQSVSSITAGTEHVIAFRVYGTQGDTVKLRIGTASGGTDIVNDFVARTGWHVVPFTSDIITTLFVQFRNENAKTVYIDDVFLLDNEALYLTAPYAEADLQDIIGVQSADVMYLFHEDYPTYKLLRYGHTSWSLERVAWQDGPWMTQNTTSTTLTPSAVSGSSVTVTASSTEGINGDEGFKSTDVGRLVRIDNPASSIDWGWGVITAVSSSTSVTVDVTDSDRPFATTNADVNWRLGMWSDTTGWPRCGVFYEQRLFVGGSTDRPQTFVASQTSDFETMSPDSANSSGVWDGTVEDDDALDYTISSNQVDAIVSMAASADSMFILTSGGIWRPTSNGAVMTPTDIAVRRQVSSPAAEIEPLAIDNVVLFVQQGKRKVRELAFNFEADGYRAFDMTRLAQHITFGNIREVAYAEEPESQVYALLETGKLLSMTFRREEDVVGWTRHVVGGSFSSGDAVVESVVTIPGNDGAGQTHDSTNRDEVWIIVKRTIDGGTKRYVEFFERSHEDGHDVEDAFYVDCGLTYDGSAASTITGLSHLEGETVKVWADGDVVADKTVSSGQITLPAAASVVQVGLGYTHKLRNLKMEGGAAAGTAVTKRKRIVKMGFVVQHSHELKYGPTSSSLSTVALGDLSGAEDKLYTGEHKVDWPDGWKDDPRVYIEGDAPAPFVLLAMAPETDTKDYV